MKILFVWTGVTGYMADCWRALAARSGVELKVLVETAESGRSYDAVKTFDGIDCRIVSAAETRSDDYWTSLLVWRPDVVFAGGWRSPSTRHMLELFPDVPKVFCLDMPWRWSLRCIAARFVLGGFLRRFKLVFVPGRLSRIYARWLGFPRSSIRERLYAVDVPRLEKAADEFGRDRRTGFLYVGRYSSEKRVDIIEKAYAEYRASGGTWTLDCLGQGGRFVQPDEMPRVYAEHACLLLASSFDPWPLVMLEAKASGMQVIASDRCGNCDELQALKVPYGDVSAMAAAMLEVEKTGVKTEERSPAGVYACGEWASRVASVCDELHAV